MKRGIILFLSFCLCGCAKPDHWSVKHIETTSRLCYHSEDKVGGINLEMLKTNERLTTYLQIPSGILDVEKAKIIVDDKEHVFAVERHRGGQRFNVPDKMQELMIGLLNDGKSFIVKIAGYKEKIEPGNFKKKFESGSYSIPFHLPF
ncbi:MAG TPA: hypothetical protein VLG76_00930 [Rhabdochlamydiaceae bacterium]|nr:hypothetical protein [Rhabdochlamydiaceae bacterium]